MSYSEHWLALTTQIKSLQAVGELYARIQGVTEPAKSLCEQCAAAYDFSWRLVSGPAGLALGRPARGRVAPGTSHMLDRRHPCGRRRGPKSEGPQCRSKPRSIEYWAAINPVWPKN